MIPPSPKWRWLERFEAYGAAQDDDVAVRLDKSMLLAAAVMMGSLAIVWGTAYLVLGVPAGAAVTYGYSGLCAVSIVAFGVTRRYRFFRFSQLLAALILPCVLMIVLGGFIASSGVIMWALMSPLGALVLAGRKQAVFWLAAYLALIPVSAVIADFVDITIGLGSTTITVFFIMNIAGVSLVNFVLQQYFLGQKERTLALLEIERNKSDGLLLNILPEEIAGVLRDGGAVPPERFDAVTVLFADIVGFTPLAATLEPVDMVEVLNEVFLYFDGLVESYGVEKIKTIGDSYMAAAGVPIRRTDHAEVMV